MDSLRAYRPELLDMSAPVLKRNMGISELIAVLQESLQRKYPATEDQGRSCSQQAQHRQYERSIELFKDFLADNKLHTANPNEATIDSFLQHLVAQDTHSNRKRYWREFAGSVRILVNALPSDILSRPLLTPKSQETTRRFDHLTPRSRTLLKEYLEDGRKVVCRAGRYLFNGKILTLKTRETAVSTTLIILDELGIADLVKLTGKKVDDFLARYTDKGLTERAIHYLNDCKSVYRYLLAHKEIKKDPLCEVLGKPFKRRDDFVSRAGIDYLLDLGNMRDKWNDLIAVRDRCMSIVLYDFCLRIGETSLLDVTDIAFVDGFVELTLRPEVQKGQGKELMWLYNFFPQTKVIIERYLELRKGLNPSSNALFVSSTRRSRLSEGRGELAVADHLDSAGLRSDKGNTITTHMYRHAFVTLNGENTGLCLSDDDLRRRLRHAHKDLLNSVYKSRTRLLALERHKELMLAIAERQQRRGLAAKKPNPFAIPSSASSFAAEDAVGEDEALSLLSHLGITRTGLRKAALHHSALNEIANEYRYARNWVDDLRRNWIPKNEAMKMLRMTQPMYWHWTNLKKIETVVVGMCSLVKSADVWSHMRGKAKGKAS